MTNHITHAENFLNCKVKNIHSDNGGKFVNDNLLSLNLKVYTMS